MRQSFAQETLQAVPQMQLSRLTINVVADTYCVPQPRAQMVGSMAPEPPSEE